MAKQRQLVAQAKFQVPGGQATSAPPVGTSLGRIGIILGQFVSQFNERTREYNGTPIPVIVSVYSDRSFEFVTKSPPASILLKQAAGLAKGSGEPNRNRAGSVKRKDVIEFAKGKMNDLNTDDMDQAVKIIEGTAHGMGITVEGAVSGVTWNTTENFTQIGASQPLSGTIRTSMWGLKNPTATSANIVVTLSAGVDNACKVVAFDGVDQTNPLGTANTATGLISTPSIAITSTSGDLVVDVVGHRNNVTTITKGAGQTEIGSQQACPTSTNCKVHMSYETATGASKTMSWAESSDEWSQVGVPLQPAATAAAIFPQIIVVE